MITTDNFLSNKEILKIKNLMYSNNSLKFPWFYDNFSNSFYHIGMEERQKISPLSDDAIFILNKFCEVNKIEIRLVLDIKAQLVIKNFAQSNEVLGSRGNKSYSTLIYCVDDADEDLLFFSERYGDGVDDRLHLSGKMPHVSGRAIMFDGIKGYSLKTPINNNTKCIISINFLIK